jgi:hypothetical protein
MRLSSQPVSWTCAGLRSKCQCPDSCFRPAKLDEAQRAGLFFLNGTARAGARPRLLVLGASGALLPAFKVCCRQVLGFASSEPSGLPTRSDERALRRLGAAIISPPLEDLWKYCSKPPAGWGPLSGTGLPASARVRGYSPTQRHAGGYGHGDRGVPIPAYDYQGPCSHWQNNAARANELSVRTKEGRCQCLARALEVLQYCSRV